MSNGFILFWGSYSLREVINVHHLWTASSVICAKHDQVRASPVWELVFIKFNLKKELKLEGLFFKYTLKQCFLTTRRFRVIWIFMTYFALSWPLDLSSSPERGAGRCINRPLCQLTPSPRAAVGGSVTHKEIPPPSLNFSLVTRPSLCLWSSSFIWPEPAGLALLGVIRNDHHPLFNPWKQRHNSLLFGDYLNTNRNSLFGCISLCSPGDWSLKEMAVGTAVSLHREDKAEIIFAVVWALLSRWQPRSAVSQLSVRAVGNWWCGFGSVFASSCSNLLCLDNLNSPGGRRDNGRSSQLCC